MEENNETIWIMRKKSRFNCEMIWIIWKTSKWNSEKIWKIWKKIEKRYGEYSRKL
jgi:hypothetical protein